jgi:hypothetical protein
MPPQNIKYCIPIVFSLTAIQLRWVLLEGTHQQHMMARITLQNQTLQPIRNYFTRNRSGNFLIGVGQPDN